MQLKMQTRNGFLKHLKVEIYNTRKNVLASFDDQLYLMTLI